MRCDKKQKGVPLGTTMTRVSVVSPRISFCRIDIGDCSDPIRSNHYRVAYRISFLAPASDRNPCLVRYRNTNRQQRTQTQGLTGRHKTRYTRITYLSGGLLWNVERSLRYYYSSYLVSVGARNLLTRSTYGMAQVVNHRRGRMYELRRA